MLDRKGLFSYLAITFALTYAILIASGFHMAEVSALAGQLVVAATMWIPALATLITIKFVTREGFGVTNFRFGSWKPNLVTAVVVPVVFAIIYGLTWLLGLGQPDWQLREFTDMRSPKPGVTTVTPMATAFPPTGHACSHRHPGSTAAPNPPFYLHRPCLTRPRPSLPWLTQGTWLHHRSGDGCWRQSATRRATTLLQ